jgi:hypothetical protein
VNGALIEFQNKAAEGSGTVLFFEAMGRFEIISGAINQNGGKTEVGSWAKNIGQIFVQMPGRSAINQRQKIPSQAVNCAQE